jgi:hypothetical protein
VARKATSLWQISGNTCSLGRLSPNAAPEAGSHIPSKAGNPVESMLITGSASSGIKIRSGWSASNAASVISSATSRIARKSRAEQSSCGEKETKGSRDANPERCAAVADHTPRAHPRTCRGLLGPQDKSTKPCRIATARADPNTNHRPQRAESETPLSSCSHSRSLLTSPLTL